MASASTVAAVYALGAIALSVGLVVLLHFLEPEFDPSWRMLSEYSLGRYGLLMRVAFIAAGTSVIAVAIALSGSAWPWDLGLVLVAIGPIGAAFIDTDPITMPRAEMSRRRNVWAAMVGDAATVPRRSGAMARWLGPGSPRGKGSRTLAQRYGLRFAVRMGNPVRTVNEVQKTRPACRDTTGRGLPADSAPRGIRTEEAW